MTNKEERQRFLHRLWGRVHAPRTVSLFMACLYLVPLTGGYLTLLYPPDTVSDIMGPVMVVVWGVLLLAGGLISAIPALFGWYLFERLGMILLGTSLAMYVTTVIEAQILSDGSRYTQLTWLIYGGAGVIILRLLTTIAYRFETPR